MSTVPLPPSKPWLSRMGNSGWSTGIVITVLALMCIWLTLLALGQSKTSRPSDPANPPPSQSGPNPPPNTIAPPGVVAPPAVLAPPGRPTTYTADQVDLLKEQVRQEERNRIAIEQQYGK